jgi:hypothetical protein
MRLGNSLLAKAGTRLEFGSEFGEMSFGLTPVFGGVFFFQGGVGRELALDGIGRIMEFVIDPFFRISELAKSESQPLKQFQ